MVERVRTDLASRARVRLLRAAPVNLPSGNHEVGAGLLVTVTAAEAERLVAAGAAERVPGGIVTKAAPSVEIVHLPAVATIAKAQGSRRAIHVTASTAAIDRMGDIVEPAGWRLDEYRRNPVVLAGHDHSQPVARATRVAVEREALVADIAFPEAGISPDADRTWALVQAGILGAVSVGFQPIRSKPLPNGGTAYLEQTLLEISVVAVPANPQALIVPPLLAERAKAKAVTGRTLRRQRELAELRAKAPRRVDRAAAELAPLRRAAAPERAAKLAAKAKAAGRARLATAAEEFAKVSR